MHVQLPATPFRGSAIDADPQDLLQPSRIEHYVDQSIDTTSNRLTFHYNYLVYHFDGEPTPIVARSYLDEADTVSILNWRDLDPASQPVRNALHYLAQRYLKVLALTATGYEPLELVPGGWIALDPNPEATP